VRDEIVARNYAEALLELAALGQLDEEVLDLLPVLGPGHLDVPQPLPRLRGEDLHQEDPLQRLQLLGCLIDAAATTVFCIGFLCFSSAHSCIKACLDWLGQRLNAQKWKMRKTLEPTVYLPNQ